jgi:fructosamine-3-kinase
VNGETRAAIGRTLGASVREVRPLAGGDINEAYDVALSDGRRVFAKCNTRADAAMFEREACGLSWLGEAGALGVPEVLGVSRGEGQASPFLLLEWLEPGPRARDFDERLGAGLGALHRFGAPSFGLARDNFIGSLPQSNQALPTWAEFYRERRLRPRLEGARRRGLVDSALDRAMERLLLDLDELVGPHEPPARLHGDLWGGNLHVDRAGQPRLIDPAVYGGHREVDLAMMRLFGGFSARVFDAYEACYPLSPGYRERVALYQLYPLLVHLELFGASYVAQVRAVLAQYG